MFKQSNYRMHARVCKFFGCTKFVNQLTKHTNNPNLFKNGFKIWLVWITMGTSQKRRYDKPRSEVTSGVDCFLMILLCYITWPGTRNDASKREGIIERLIKNGFDRSADDWVVLIAAVESAWSYLISPFLDHVWMIAKKQAANEY